MLNCGINYDLIYTDENSVDYKTGNFLNHHFKPDFSPDMLRSFNYIGQFFFVKTSLLNKIGIFESMYDLLFKIVENTDKIYHIPKILYSSANILDYRNQKEILQKHINRIGLNANVTDGDFDFINRINYKINEEKLISIIIPNKDHIEDLRLCISSILNKSTYKNYEIIVVENNSETTEIFDYYKEINRIENINVVYYKGKFNYSKINNFGVTFAKGDYYILLNNDIEIITPNWIEEMLMFCQRDDVGIVGAKLLYPDDTIQHAGVLLGVGHVAGHSHRDFLDTDLGYFGRPNMVQNLSAVTAACLMIKRGVFTQVDGLNEDFEVAYNDVDLCMKVRKKGYLIVYTPYAKAYHYESKSRGEEDTPQKLARYKGEVARFHSIWKNEIATGDPYYNENLTIFKEDFSLR